MNAHMYQSTIPATTVMNLCRENKVSLRFKPRPCRDEVSCRKYNLQTEICC